MNSNGNLLIQRREDEIPVLGQKSLAEGQYNNDCRCIKYKHLFKGCCSDEKDNGLVDQRKLLIQSGFSCSKSDHRRRFAKMNRVSKILGAIIILFACFFIIYEILDWNLTELEEPYVIKLKSVYLINRHGDRAPSDGFQANDKHQDAVNFFWPNGLSNLTELGKTREYRLGLKLRQLYKDYLDFDKDEILALTSGIYRCGESLRLTLKGLFSIEQTRYAGLQSIKEMENIKIEHRECLLKIGRNSNQDNCQLTLPSGSGAANQYKEIEMKSNVVPSLNWRYLAYCPWREKNPSIYDKSLLLNKKVLAIEGLNLLEKIMFERYGIRPVNYTISSIWSTIVSELNVARTIDTYNYTDHFNDWINLPVNLDDDQSATLFDLLEQLTLILYRDRIAGRAKLIQLAPIITSLIDSQLVALNREAELVDKSVSLEEYKNKKLILASTHDTVILNILDGLNLLKMEEPFEKRFAKYHNDKEDYKKFLNFLQMPAFGCSLRFELIEIEFVGENLIRPLVDGMISNHPDNVSSNNYNGGDGLKKTEKFHIVKLFIYNDEDANQNIHYHPLELGTMCEKQFIHMYPMGKVSDFYNADFIFDKRYGCPFDLFKNITSNLLMPKHQIDQLCNDVN